MANMIVDSLRRTGKSTSKFRQIVAVTGEHERVLSTPIEKVSLGFEFRHGGRAVPMEQYHFVVRGKTYERFADATAAVMKIHHIVIVEDESVVHQVYVRKAVAILTGREALRLLEPAPMLQLTYNPVAA